MLNGTGALKPFPRPGTVGELTAINNIEDRPEVKKQP